MSTLHITNGDSAADTLRLFVDGDVIATADVLHEGPAPAVPLDEWYDVRARFLADSFAPDARAVRARLRATDERIAGTNGPVVLWFEHDLFDQLQLIRTLDLLRTHNPASRTGALPVSLICIDRFPGVERFVGLGQLTADQLRTLVGAEVPVTSAQFELATRAWTAFRAADPTGLAHLVRERTDALSFLGPALRRFLQEYPSVRNGLSRTADAVLRALAPAPLEAGAVFMATQAAEEAPFMGDWPLFDIVHDLANARVPLLTIAPPRNGVDLRGHTIALTDAGRAVLDGVRDAVTLNGIDRWRGGVRLEGRDRSPWRWDEEGGRLVS